MGFFEKVKNMFTEEVEEDDVKVEQVKGEATKVSFEAPKEEAEEKLEKTDRIEKVDRVERNLEETKVNKPVFFDDDDFKDLSFGVKEEKKEEAEEKVEEEKPVYRRTSFYEEEIVREEPKPAREIYGSKIEKEVVVEEKKIFKPTPIISPVYGILDKNYHKEDIVSRNEVREEKENPIDSVRNKAYGTLEDDLENTLFGTNSILFKKDEDKTQTIEVNDDVLTNLTDDISKELDELLIKKEKINYDEDEDKTLEDEIIPEEPEEKPRHISSEDEEDLLGFIDSTLYKGGEDE